MEQLSLMLSKFIEKDALGLSKLFDKDASFDDNVTSGVFNTETHLIGREAIHMHFSNRFIFQTYLVSGGKVTDNENAEMEIVTQNIKKIVKVHLKSLTAEGKIKGLLIEQA